MSGFRGWRVSVALALPAMLGLVACGDDDDEAVSAYTVTAVVDGENYRFEGLPAQLEGGTVTFTLDNTNGGDAAHELQIIKVDEGTTFDQIKTGLLETESAPFPDFMGDVGGGIGTIGPGATASTTQELSEGTYTYFCAISDDEEDAPSHYDIGMEGTFTVEGDGAQADAPDASGTVTAKDYGFEFADLTAGTTTIEFKNEGDEFHHFLAVPLNPGATVEDATAAFESEEEPEGPPPVDFEKAVSTAVLGPGQAITTDVTFEAGTYVFVCFITDKAGGEPHVAKGMIGSVQIS